MRIPAAALRAVAWFVWTRPYDMLWKFAAFAVAFVFFLWRMHRTHGS
jgi:hypothetical protein